MLLHPDHDDDFDAWHADGGFHMATLDDHSNEPLLSGLHDYNHDLHEMHDSHQPHDDVVDDLDDDLPHAGPFQIAHPMMRDPVALEDTTSGSCSSTDSPDASDDFASNDPLASKLFTSNNMMMKNKGNVTPLAERESHNAMERMRRVNIRICFESLQSVVPELRAKKSHTLNILQVCFCCTSHCVICV